MAGAHILILPERYGLDAGYFFRMLGGLSEISRKTTRIKSKRKT
jgi:hypothetical protein